jgi:homoserine/homoserine lactone efflux protein
MDPSALCLFIITFSSLLILPGPNSAFAVGQALKYGLKRSLWVPLGFMCATGVHAVLVFSGAGILVHNFPSMLLTGQFLGAAYLVYLSYKTFTAPLSPQTITQQGHSRMKMFLSAMLVSMTNPKALLASMMLYPLFITLDNAYLLQAFILGGCAMVISFTIYASYAWLAHIFRHTLQSSRLANNIVAALYLIAACVLIFKNV